MRAALLLLALALPAAAQTGTVQERWGAVVKALKETKFFSAKRYDELAKRLEAGAPDDATAADMTQLMFDHMLAQQALEQLYRDLGELKGVSAPETIEVDELALTDGRVLPGCAAFLAKLHPEHDPKLYAGQRIINPNFGIAGLDNWWIAAEDVKTAKRVRVPLPKLVLVAGERQTVEGTTLTVSGTWQRPGRKGHEDVKLELVETSGGGCLFVNKDLGLRVFLPAVESEALQEKLPKADRETFERWHRKKPAPAAEPLPDFIDAWRRRAPAVEWPEPFEPGPEAVKALAERRKDLEDENDAAATVQRFRIQLTYGEVPDLAKKTPAAFLELEAKTREFLKGGKPGKLADLDPALLALLLRRAPDFDAPPAPGVHDGVFLRFPKNYSGWRRWPLLVVLHGQYHQPEYDFGLWSPLADEFGMILACPTYGSTEGTDRSPKADAVVMDVVKKLCLERNVDPDRVYLTGISMGGAMTWRLAQSYPGRWAAAAPEIHGPKLLDGKFPYLRNLATLPLYVFEGEFDGLNTVHSRRAVAELTAMNAPVEYRETRWFGHDRMTWRYPAILDWAEALRRDAHPLRIEHRAFNAYEASRAWLSIRRSLSDAFGRDDGAYSPDGLTGVEAVLDKDTITLRTLDGKPREVELWHDPAIMGKSLTVTWGDTTVTWKVKPSAKVLLDRVRETGDREALCDDRLKVTQK